MPSLDSPFPLADVVCLLGILRSNSESPDGQHHVISLLRQVDLDTVLETDKIPGGCEFFDAPNSTRRVANHTVCPNLCHTQDCLPMGR